MIDPIQPGDLFPEKKEAKVQNAAILDGGDNPPPGTAVGVSDEEQFPERLFTRDAYEALLLAVDLVKTTRTEVLGTEHLILGIKTVKRCRSWRLLEEAGVTFTSVQAAFSAAYVNVGSESRFRNVHLSRNARDVLIWAKEEAGYDDSERIGTEHILLALIFGGTGKGERFLREAGVNFFDLGGKIVEALDSEKEEA